MTPKQAANNPLTIIRLRATGYQRLTAEGVDVKFNPDGGITFIEGRNSQGKSATLDALEFGIVGKTALSKKPIHDGLDEAKVELTLSNNKRIIRHVRRKGEKDFTTALELVGADGEKYAAAEATVREWLGDPGISFDPMDFARMEPKKRRALLAKTVGIDLELFAAQEKNAEQARLAHYGQYEAAKRKYETKPDLPANPPASVDVSALNDKLNQQIRENEQLQEARRAAEGARRTAADALSGIESTCRNLTDEIAGLEQQLAAKRKSLSEWQAGVPTQEAKLAEATKACSTLADRPLHDTSAIQQQIADASGLNSQAAQYTILKQQAEEIDATWKRENAKREELTAKVEEVREARLTALREAVFPVEGLGFEDEDCTYLGQPFSQASQSEKIKVGMALAMSQNPNLRLITSSDGSLFDSENLKVAHEMTAGRGYVLVMEAVRDEPSGRPNSIWIEAGSSKEPQDG